MRKILDFLFKRKNWICQFLVVTYKRAIMFYGQHYDRKGLLTIIKCGFKSLFTSPRLKIVYYDQNKEEQFQLLLKKMTVSYDDSSRFYYWIDEQIFFNNRYNVIGNLPIDYSLVVDNSISDIKRMLNEKGSDNENFTRILDYVESYVERICIELSNHSGQYVNSIISNLRGMKDAPAKNLEDALQRILFWNALLHQIGQKLVGLGRLDKIIDRFEILDLDDSKRILKDFCETLHKHYYFKSQAVFGDTGQLIILGGTEENGGYFANKYTYLFIDVIKELDLPDPKLMLRVSKHTPKDIIDKALDCISTGIGSPLFSNDDIVIPLLIQYGFERLDAYNYVVSACWEPLIVGKSMDQNNIYTIPFAGILTETLDMSNEENISSFDDLLEFYGKLLHSTIDRNVERIDKIEWEYSPLISLFFEECRTSGIDISQGGAKYNNYGLLTDGLSNTVNSLLNIKKLVFTDRRMTIDEVRTALKNGYNGSEKLKEELKNSSEYFGMDAKSVVELTNMIFDMAKRSINSKKNRFGGCYKVGLSSPNYLVDGYDTQATFDGRLAREPLGTHISCDKNLAYTELISFASKIDYSNGGFNGNVVDIMITPDFINNHRDKFVCFIQSSIDLGFFQMQMNVVSSDILKEAKKSPDKYRSLIVRVWGFSAYYVELPEYYQDMLIERALKNEGKAA